MKKNIHPKLITTLIQLKDGSTYLKRWLFFKSVLSLEIDYLGHIFWKKAVTTPSKNN
jgi:ribosomal protein L31